MWLTHRTSMQNMRVQTCEGALVGRRFALRAPILLAGLTMMLIGNLAVAKDIGLELSAWTPSVSGRAEDASGSVDFEEIGVDGRTRPYLAAHYWQDDGSWWPDMSLTYCRIDAAGSGVVEDSAITIGGILILPGSTAEGKADVDDVTLELSYPIVRTSMLGVDAGIAVRYLSGNVLIRDENATQADEQRVDMTFPMPMLTVRLQPLPWLALLAQGAWIERGDDRAFETYFGAQAEIWRGWSLQAGWLRKRYDVYEQDYRLDSDLDGLRAGLQWRYALN